MLLIGDIHINARYKDKILQSIRDFVSANPEEKSIVFLGDYVYHFSYDRKAILEFFDLLIDIYKLGKNLYVLCGNHDWIGESFIFDEAQKSFEILNQLSNNKIYFITKDLLTDIEGNKILFLPFNINLKAEDTKQFESLVISSNKNEQVSAHINSILSGYVTDNPGRLFVIHHYYFANINFPGQFAKFNYKDISLSDHWLDNKDLYFISGHLHKGFVHGNYLCTGAVWSSSTLESNDFKFMYRFDPQTLDVQGYSYNINPYISIQDVSGLVDEKYIQDKISELYENNKSYFSKGAYKMSWGEITINLSDLNIVFKTKDFDYENVDKIFDKALVAKVKDIKIKKVFSQDNNIIDMLEISDKDLQKNISDRKELLKSYIIQKFPDNQVYLDKLKELKLI